MVHCMTVLEGIMRRRSVRRYDGRAVPDDEMRTILTAGGAAPIGMGRFDDMHMTVVTDRDRLSEIGKRVGEAMSRILQRENAPFDFYGASTLVLISSREAVLPGIDYADAGGVAENMMIQAAADGLGSCIIWASGSAVDGDEGLRRALRIPDGFHPLFGIVFGYAADEPGSRDADVPRIASDVI